MESSADGDGGHTLVTLNHDRLMLDLLRLGWRDHSTGVDSDAEESYRLSDHLSVGLRYEYRRDSARLDTGTRNRLSLTTRLSI